MSKKTKKDSDRGVTMLEVGRMARSLPAKTLKRWVRFGADDAERRCYMSRSGRVLHLAGFSVTGPGVRRISAETAAELHLGQVRAIVDLTSTTTTVVRTALSQVTRRKAG